MLMLRNAARSPLRRRHSVGCWRRAVVGISLILALGLPTGATHAQTTDCEVQNLRGSQGCTLRLGELKRYSMATADEQHKWRLDLDVATNVQLKLYTMSADYELWLYD